MKKYLQNRKTSEVICDNCGKTCIKPNSEIIRSKKLSRKLYCSRQCSGKAVGTTHLNDIPKYDISKHSDNRSDNLTPFRYYLRNSKNRFKEFDLTLEDLKDIWDNQKGKCPYTGYDMLLNTYNARYKNNMLVASLDRIDSSKGYVKDNVEFVCVAINYLKNTFSKEDTTSFLYNLDFSKDRTISSSDC